MKTYTWKQAVKANQDDVIESAKRTGDIIIDKRFDSDKGANRWQVIRVTPKRGVQYYVEFQQLNGECIETELTLDLYSSYSHFEPLTN